jgi:hypothetical protein
MALGLAGLAISSRRIDAAGVDIAAGGSLVFEGAGSIDAPSDGVFRLLDAAGTSFGRLCFGPATSSFAAIKASGASLEARLGDDSARCSLLTGALVSNSYLQVAATGKLIFGNLAKMKSSVDGSITLTDNAETDFANGLLFAGTTSGFPGLFRAADRVRVRKADDSGFANLEARFLYANLGVYTEPTGSIYFNGRAKLFSPASDALETAGSGGTGTAAYHVLNEYASGSDPAAAAANTVRLYVRDNGSGKGELCARFATGAIQVVASEP